MAATGPASVVGDVDNATRLRRATKRRQSRGGWLVALVILLAVLAATAGWWFGSGPGSLVAVAGCRDPDVRRGAGAARRGLARRASSRARTASTSPAGQVIGTDPPSGSRVEKDSEVKVLVSLGPAEVQVESLAGKTEAEARGILESNVIAVAEQNDQYFTDAAAGVVVGMTLAPADGAEPFACGEGCTAHQGDSATLWVSLGPVPDVTGESEGSARSTLEGLQLVVADPSATEASDAVEEGRVIRMNGRDDGGWLRPGDTVTLVVSTGPPLFAVPELVGLTLARGTGCRRRGRLHDRLRRRSGRLPRPVHRGRGRRIPTRGETASAESGHRDLAADRSPRSDPSAPTSCAQRNAPVGTVHSRSLTHWNGVPFKARRTRAARALQSAFQIERQRSGSPGIRRPRRAEPASGRSSHRWRSTRWSSPRYSRSRRASG